MTVVQKVENSVRTEMSNGPCSALRIAYIIGGPVDPNQTERIDSGSHPRVEYHTFLERNIAEVISTKHFPKGRSTWVKIWQRLGKHNYALAARAAEYSHKYDAMLVSGEDIGFPIVLSMFARIRKTPIFIITHGSYFGSKKFRQFAILLRGASFVHFLCLAESLCKTLTDDFHIPKNRVHNTGYGVDTTFFKPKTSEQAPVIASAGTANRDYKTLVKATSGLDVNLVIAVDSEWFPMAVDIRSDDVPAHVEARSFGDYLSLRDLYARAAVIVVPLYQAKHACGYAVIAEAMAMGKCVIATNTDSSSDFIVDGVSGFYVPVQDPIALRNCVKRLLENPDLRANVEAAARKRMEELFSLDAYCSRIEGVIALGTKIGN